LDPESPCSLNDSASRGIQLRDLGDAGFDRQACLAQLGMKAERYFKSSTYRTRPPTTEAS
jgi:hypothetical protein